MQAYQYLTKQEKGGAGEALQTGSEEKQPDYAPAKTGYPDFHIRYRADAKPQSNAKVIQCFPEESRTLTREAKEIREATKRRAKELELEISDLDIHSQFDDDIYELSDQMQMLPAVHETLHHILSRSSIDKLIRNLNPEEKKKVLLTFLRYTGGGGDDVTQEEYEKITAGTDKESSDLVNQMLERTLKSLRSNLTFGPTDRRDDPKDGFDPNYVPGSGGQMDEISACYGQVYVKIGELQNNSARHNELVEEIVEHLKQAESLLAQKQGLIGADAYRHTRLEMGKIKNWVLDFRIHRKIDGTIGYVKASGYKSR